MAAFLLLASLVVTTSATVIDENIHSMSDRSMPSSYISRAIKKETCILKDDCEAYPRTCKDVRSGSGSVYMMATMYDMMEMLCDVQTDGGGWTVIQRRQYGDLSFYRSWSDYKYGFGKMSGDFWFGLEKIYQLTSKGRYELYVSFMWEGRPYYAKYKYFSILGEKDRYKLYVDGYSGNAGDSLKNHNGVVFSTKDDDYTIGINKDCSRRFQGGWWYMSCHHVNLNGVWASKTFGVGLNWKATTGYYDSAYDVVIKIRKY